jgi:hypothetical protein
MQPYGPRQTTLFKRIAHYRRDSASPYEGYQLWDGQDWVTFRGAQALIDKALDRPLAPDETSRLINWRVTWGPMKDRLMIVPVNVVFEIKKEEEEMDKDNKETVPVAVSPQTAGQPLDMNARMHWLAFLDRTCVKYNISQLLLDRLIQEALGQSIDDWARTNSLEAARNAVQRVAQAWQENMPETPTLKQLKEEGKLMTTATMEYPETPRPTGNSNAVTGEPPHADWIDDSRKRGAFFRDYEALCNRYAVPQEAREPLRRAFLLERTGFDSLKGWRGTAQELWALLEERIKAEYQNEMVTKETGMNQVSNATSQTAATAIADKVDEIRKKHTILVKGKEYLRVPGRVALFRHKNPTGTIRTKLVSMDSQCAVFKAWVVVDGTVLATAHGYATLENTKNLDGRFLEKAETAAVGRALALAGFGTDDSLDDSDYLSDSPLGGEA